jgi:dihydrofolate synthase/folylpolyglutamate synthase
MRTLAEWLALQESVHPQSIDMGLERVARVAQALELSTPASAVLTVGGTNGKGSVAAHLEALVRAHGARAGLFTSPHLVRYNERIRIGGAEVDDAALIGAFERIEAARGTTTLTFFEYNTLAALWLFAAADVDVAVLEVGLGGRLDATNLVDADVAVLASVGFDHREYLGDSLERIGAEKAGIFRSARPAVLGSIDMPSSVAAAISARDARAIIAERDFGWRVHEADWDYLGLSGELPRLPPSALAGVIQYRNAATALAALEALLQLAPAGRGVRRARGVLAPLSAARVAGALRAVQLPGRFEIVPGEIEWILDIAHNEPAARVLAGQLRARAPPGPRGRTYAVIGVLGDKDAAAIARELAGVIDHWIVCTLEGPRGQSAGALAARLGCAPGRCELVPSVVSGCELARTRAGAGDRIVVCGSLHTVGPAREWLGLY